MITLNPLVPSLFIWLLLTSANAGNFLQEQHSIQEHIPSLYGGCAALETDKPTNPNEGGFYFENPETDCKYASQPYIYDVYQHIASNLNYIMEVLVPNVDFTIVGHNPVAGHYHDVNHVWTNVFWRLTSCFSLVYPEEFDMKLLHIHGGCNQQWSVQEMVFGGRANTGHSFEMPNVWMTKWENGKMIEVRIYFDALVAMRILYENELWTNSSTNTDHLDFVPGPWGMPDMAALSELMAKYGHH